MKTNIERFAFSLILAPLAPLAGLLGFWWISFALLPERWISICAISGLVLGILVDISLLKNLITRANQNGMAFWIVIFSFYTVGLFGFFMGLPVFNTALAIPTGFVVGGKLARNMADRSKVRATTLRTCIFTTFILTCICIITAMLALNETSMPAQLESMLFLPFSVTWGMIWGLILVGGAGLLAVNWVLTWLSIRLTHRYLYGT
jgi:hypothetical protein